MKNLKVIFFIFVVLALMLTGSSVWAQKDLKDLKAAFIYVGPIGDGGWTYAHDLGRRHLETLGIQTAYIESVPETDSTRAIRNFARRGYDVVFTTSFGYMDPTINVAKSFPKTIFMHCSGFKTADNVGNYFGRIYQAKYLAGMLAGYMTKTNVIGVTGSHPIPEIIRHINAFTLGARSINPNAKVKVVWINSWFDPSKEAAAGESLIDDGADIISITTDCPAALQVAEKRGKYAIGNDSDMTLYAPKSHLASAVFNWDIYYEYIARQIAEGTWKPTSDWWGLKEGIADIVSFGDMVTRKVKWEIDQKKKAIIDGEFVVFEGPIKNQEGTLAVENGQRLTDQELLSIDYFVEGVVGTVPK